MGAADEVHAERLAERADAVRVVVGKDDDMNAVVLQTADKRRDLLSGQGGLVRDHRAVKVDQRGADAVALQDPGRDVVYRVENVIGYEFAHSYTLSERTEKNRSEFLQETFGLSIKSPDGNTLTGS